MTIEFLAPARLEMREAVGYLNGKEQGLGQDFAREVKAARRSVWALMAATWSPMVSEGAPWEPVTPVRKRA